MSAHRVYAEQEHALRAGITLVKDPGSAGTITWDNKQDAMCEVTTAGAESRVLPTATGYALGQRLIVIGKAITTSLTITGADSSVILTSSGDRVSFIVSNNAGTRVWRIESNSNIAASANGSKTVSLPIGNSWRVFDAIITNLAGADGTDDLGLVTGVFDPTSPASNVTPTFNVTVATPSGPAPFYARFSEFRLPANYRAGTNVTLVINCTQTVAATTANVDAYAFRPAAPATDLVATAAQSIIGAAATDYSFTITGTNLTPLATLDITIAILLADVAATPNYSINSVSLTYTAG